MRRPCLTRGCCAMAGGSIRLTQHSIVGGRNVWTERVCLNELPFKNPNISTLFCHLPFDNRLCLPEWHALMMLSLSTPHNHIGDVELEFQSVLNSILDGGEWLISRSGRFTPVIIPRFLLNRKLDGPLEPVWTFFFWRETFCLWRDSKAGPSMP